MPSRLEVRQASFSVGGVAGRIRSVSTVNDELSAADYDGRDRASEPCRAR